jgi:tocopherol O-methyltransferase
MLDHCVQMLNLHGGEDVLDAGCGHGGTLLYLARLLRCQGTGLTISLKQAQIARENAAKARLGDWVSFVVDDADTFQFPAKAFDLVWAMESSEHFGNKANFFHNVAHALRPGGQLLLAAWTGSMEQPRVREVARVFLCPELWTAAQYTNAIVMAGMRVTQCENLTSQVVRTWKICKQRAQAARPVVKLLPRSAREFVEGIKIILDAYCSGDLTYTVVTASI